MRAAAVPAQQPLEQQLAETFEAHKLRGYWVALDIVHDPEEAADLVQEAFLRVQQSLPRFRGECSLRTYVLRVIVNLALKSERRRRVRAKLRHLLLAGTHASEVEPYGANTPERVASESEQGRWLSAALARLPAKQRAAFVLRHGHDLPLEEVAAVLRVSAGTVKTHLRRAVKQLRRALPQENTETGP